MRIGIDPVMRRGESTEENSLLSFWFLLIDSIMRIGIDCRMILDEKARQTAGVAHYTWYLVKTLLKLPEQHSYVLFFDSLADRGVVANLAHLDNKVEIEYWRFSKYKRFLPYIYSHILLAAQILKANLDIYHSPANVIPLRIFKQEKRPKLVVTIHDLAIYRHPEWFPPRQGFSIKYLVPQVIQKVDRIIVPSQVTKRDVVELFRVPEEKIKVIPHGVEPRFFESGNSKFQIPNSKYILFVGTLEPRKNLLRLIQAYAGLPQEILAKYDLIIAGRKGWKYQDVEERIKNLELRIKQKIKLLGYVLENDLPNLMQNAALFIYPSLYEGFGLPVLEAMAAGVPVVTSHEVARNLVSSIKYYGSTPPPSPPYQGGGNRGGAVRPSSSDIRVLETVDPYSVAEIREAIVKLIRDSAYSREIAKHGKVIAKAYTWERTARQTLQVYQSLQIPQ